MTFLSMLKHTILKSSHETNLKIAIDFYDNFLYSI
jgi:hypothetical protein